MIPKTITIGDRVVWRFRDLIGKDPVTGSVTDLDPAIYELSFSLRGATGLDVTAVPDNGQFLTIIEDTSTLVAGNYYYQAYISRDGFRNTYGTGTIEAVVNYGAITEPFDGRTQLEKDLETIESAIRVVVAGGVQSYSIQGRSLSKSSISELMGLRDSYRAELQRQKAAEAVMRGEANPRRAFVRFGR